MTAENSEEENKSTIDVVLEYWRADSKIDRHNAGEEAAKIPQLHFKYLNLLRQANAKLIKLRQRKKQMYLEKKHYFSGKASDEVYKKDNFHLKVMKTDLDVYIDADDQFSRIVSKIEEYENLAEVLKSILGMIKDRNWQVRNIIEHDKFISGG